MSVSNISLWIIWVTHWYFQYLIILLITLRRYLPAIVVYWFSALAAIVKVVASHSFRFFKTLKEQKLKRLPFSRHWQETGSILYSEASQPCPLETTLNCQSLPPVLTDLCSSGNSEISRVLNPSRLDNFSFFLGS